jgi:hypothetical protein
VSRGMEPVRLLYDQFTNVQHIAALFVHVMVASCRMFCEHAAKPFGMETTDFQESHTSRTSARAPVLE